MKNATEYTKTQEYGSQAFLYKMSCLALCVQLEDQHNAQQANIQCVGCLAGRPFLGTFTCVATWASSDESLADIK